MPEEYEKDLSQNPNIRVSLQLAVNKGTHQRTADIEKVITKNKFHYCDKPGHVKK